jgi:chromosome segregation ATPase
LLTEKLLENAKAAIDEARQHADEINKLSHRVQELQHSLDQMAQEKAEEAAKRQQLADELLHLKAENVTLADNLTQENARATSLQHEVDRLRQKLAGPKTDPGNATPQAQESMAKLEAEVDKLRRSLDHLWKTIESQREDDADETYQTRKRWGMIWRSLVWLCVLALGGVFAATYLGFLK